MDTPVTKPGPWGSLGLEAPTTAELEKKEVVEDPVAKNERDKVERAMRPVDMKRLQAAISEAADLIRVRTHFRALVIIGIGHNSSGGLGAASHCEGVFSHAFAETAKEAIPSALGQMLHHGDIVTRAMARDGDPLPPLPKPPGFWARLWCRLFHRH